MNISNLYLKAFYQLAQSRSFTKAAGELAITQSAFSHRIINLERDLELTLFVREEANVHLTEAGEDLLRYCEKLYRLESEYLSETHNGASLGLTGSLRIAGFSSIMRSPVLPALSPLLRKNPRLNLNLLPDQVEEIGGLLKSSKVDFAISTKTIPGHSIQSEFLGFEQNVLVESNRYDFQNYYLDHNSKDEVTDA